MVETVISIAAVSYLVAIIIGIVKYVWPQEQGRPKWVVAVFALAGSGFGAGLIGIQSGAYQTMQLPEAMADTILAALVAAGGALAANAVVGEAAKPVEDQPFR